jgi:hypothetical protein
VLAFALSWLINTTVMKLSKPSMKADSRSTYPLYELLLSHDELYLVMLAVTLTACPPLYYTVALQLPLYYTVAVQYSVSYYVSLDIVLPACTFIMQQVLLYK